jgi:hypothetical protein
VRIQDSPCNFRKVALALAGFLRAKLGYSSGSFLFVTGKACRWMLTQAW